MAKVKQRYKVIPLMLMICTTPLKEATFLLKLHELNKLCKMGFKMCIFLHMFKVTWEEFPFYCPTKWTLEEGWYILVKGCLDHREITLLNVHRPPGNSKQLINFFWYEVSGTLICGGDWNIHLNPFLDSSSKIKSQTEAIYIKMLKESGLMDKK